MQKGLRKTPEEILQINDFKQSQNRQWVLENLFGTIRVDLDKQEIIFKGRKEEQLNHIQKYDVETFDCALVAAYMRSGMYDYLRQNQGET